MGYTNDKDNDFSFHSSITSISTSILWHDLQSHPSSAPFPFFPLMPHAVRHFATLTSPAPQFPAHVLLGSIPFKTTND
jgi:hypothetical protein